MFNEINIITAYITVFYHASVVMLFHSQTSFLYFFLFLYKKLEFHIIQKVLEDEKNKIGLLFI